MTDDIRVLYNDTCPICSREVAHYRRLAKGEGIAFDTLSAAPDWGLTDDQAAQSLHVLQDGQLLRGTAAFRALWAALPGRHWQALAWIAGLPGIRQAVDVIYDRVAAPLLYRAHLKRQARKGLPRQDG